MAIISLQFILFVTAFLLLYFLVPKKYQRVVILLGDLVFYLFSGIAGLLFALLAAVISFLFALKIQDLEDSAKRNRENTDPEKKRTIDVQLMNEKKKYCAIAVILIIGTWILLKNEIFGSDSFSIIVPLGISYYSFDAISYVIDISRNKYSAEKDFSKYLTYFLFFPHITQGPFSRYDSLSKDLFEEHSFSYERLCNGTSRILWGFFKKTVIVDKISLIVREGLSNYVEYGSSAIFMTVVLYSIQLYADFSAYMDIVCGISHIIDIKLTENFEQPYFSKSVEEFWRRWHISLGNWFKDYVFYPVSTSKRVQKIGKYFRNRFSRKAGKIAVASIALLFTWTATALWHGFTLNYLIWGHLNMLAIAIPIFFADFDQKWKEKLGISIDSLPWKGFCMIGTFVLICLIRVFSFTSDIATAVSIYQNMLFGNGLSVLELLEKTDIAQLMIVAFGVIAMLIVDILKENGKWDRIKEKCPMLLRNLVYVVLIVSIILFAGESSDLLGGFMYAHF